MLLVLTFQSSKGQDVNQQIDVVVNKSQMQAAEIRVNMLNSKVLTVPVHK